MEIENKIKIFYEQNSDNLLKTYIIERKNHNNILGALFCYIGDNNNDVKVFYLDITSENLSKNVKEDLESKNNSRNSIAFFYVTDIKMNKTLLFQRNLE